MDYLCNVFVARRRELRAQLGLIESLSFAKSKGPSSHKGRGSEPMERGRGCGHHQIDRAGLQGVER